MNRSLALLFLIALSIPRFIAPSAANGHALPTTIVHDIFVDPTVYSQSVGNVYLVGFQSLAAKDMFVQMVTSKALMLPPGVEFLHAYHYVPFVVLGGDAKAVVEFVRTIPGTTGVRANKKFYLDRNLEPSNPTPTNLGDVLKLGAQTFRNAGYTGMGIVIAIIDTGIRKDHPEFNYDNGTCKVIYEESFVLTIYGYDRNETNPDDGVGHGTMVAGAAAGLGKQPDGQGVAPDAALVNLKVFPSGQDTYATSAGIIAAIDRAIELKVSGQVDIDIINMSLGGSANIHYDPEIAAVNAAIAHGIAVVIAAGNEGNNGIASGYVSSPGIAPLAITAGAAYGRNSTIEGYSSPGPTPRLGVKPDVVAPGSGSYPCPPFVSDYLYRAAAGTSFASPHVAGSVALLLQYIHKNAPDVDPVAAIGYAKAVLMDSAVHTIKDVKTNVTFDELRTGAGFVNLTKAYEMLTKNPTPGIIYVLPSHLPVGLVYNGSYPIVGPIFPRSKGVYVGQEITVNFTITSGIQTTLSVVFTGDIANVFQLVSANSVDLKPPTTTYAFKAIVANVTAGTYTGAIAFEFPNGTIAFQVPVVVNVLGEPKIKLLRDLHHTDRGVDTPYGQFALFAKNLALNGVAIDILTLDENFTLDNIKAYDRIFTGDFASGVTLSVEDAKTFIDYISNGGHVIALVMDTVYYDINAIGRLTYTFGIAFGTENIQNNNNPVKASRNSSLPFGLSGYMPMYGIPVKPMNPGVLELARYSSRTVAAAAITQTGGALVVFGTNFLFDNRGMTGQYGVPVSDIMGSMLNLMKFDYVNRLAMNMLSNAISISGELSIGSTVSVSVNIPALKVVHNDRVMAEEVSGNFKIERAGPNAIGISLSVGNFPFGLIYPLRVEPSEYDAPQVSQPEKVVMTTPNSELKIPVKLTDQTGVEENVVEVAVYVLKVTGRMSVKPSSVEFSGSPQDATMYIVFTPDQFAILFGTSNNVTIRVIVTVFDLNYNYDTEALDYVAEINNAPQLDVSYTTSAGQITLNVTINDDDQQDRLIVYLDGNVVYNETVTVGQQVTINISAEAGTHNVTVVAIDPVGNEAKRSESITVPSGTSKTLIIGVAIAIVAILLILFRFLKQKRA